MDVTTPDLRHSFSNFPDQRGVSYCSQLPLVWTAGPWEFLLLAPDLRCGVPAGVVEYSKASSGCPCSVLSPC